MMKPKKEMKKELNEMYRSVQKSGFINVRTLRRKYDVGKIKTLDDIKIKNLDKINPKKLETLQYLLMRLRNLGYDFGYNEWFENFDLQKLNKKLDSLSIEKKDEQLLEMIKQLAYEIGLEMKDVKIEPSYYQSMIQKQFQRKLELEKGEKRHRIIRGFTRHIIYPSLTIAIIIGLVFGSWFVFNALSSTSATQVMPTSPNPIFDFSNPTITLMWIIILYILFRNLWR